MASTSDGASGAGTSAAGELAEALSKLTVEETEEWRKIPNYDGYEVSNIGNVRNDKTKRVISIQQTKIGYTHVTLRVNKKYVGADVHRLVALAFLENPDNKRTVNHKNKIRNDNRVSNLEWATYSEQNSHSHSFSHQDSYTGTSYLPEPKPDEIWRESKLLVGYEVSNHGSVRRTVNKRMKTILRDGRGYCSVNAVLVHRIVAEAFLENYSLNLVVNHKDGNKSNNHVSNLECITQSQNILHANAENLNSNHRRYPVIQVDYLGNVVGSYKSYAEAGLHLGDKSSAAISCAVNTNGVAFGYRWYKTYEDYEKDKPNIFASIFKVFQHTEDGTQIAVYNDFHEAAKASGTTHGAINSAVNKFKDKLRQSGGYIWTTTRVPKTELLTELRAKKPE